MAKRTTAFKSTKRATATAKPKITAAPSALQSFIANPAVRYVASGIATALLARMAKGLAAKYPEISRFVGEQMDTIEGKLVDFKNGLENDTVARH